MTVNQAPAAPAAGDSPGSGLPLSATERTRHRRLRALGRADRECTMHARPAENPTVTWCFRHWQSISLLAKTIGMTTATKPGNHGQAKRQPGNHLLRNVILTFGSPRECRPRMRGFPKPGARGHPCHPPEPPRCVMCPHQPSCPPANAPDCQAARVVACHPEQGWSLLCNGVVAFDDTGALLPSGRSVPPRRLHSIGGPARPRAPVTGTPRRQPLVLAGR